MRAARQCLEQRGYGNTTARDIAAAAGVSLGNISYHFESVEALLTEALGQSAREWIEQFAMTGGMTPAPTRESVGNDISDFYALLRNERHLLVAFIEALARSSHVPKLRQQLARQYREFREAATEQISASLGPELVRSGIDPAVVASLLVALSDGLIVQFLLDPTRMPSEDDLVHLLQALGLQG